jgi:hypothetical protein
MTIKPYDYLVVEGNTTHIYHTYKLLGFRYVVGHIYHTYKLLGFRYTLCQYLIGHAPKSFSKGRTYCTRCGWGLS